ncbi:Rap1-interacting factor 1 N terminal-domain-containing protein [Sphaerosporella brunnea]|uniref:Rap1-interacting factor 1 N terminal-domain-containing protein n=1 Tax=Sphaerosporella brunnea TaxID=1250544 RepID=A0A5J5F4D4_9PEZI|nr:Rap1-interacting factor 1 N terminal-domain-containing protein [Sphaerosporella brunnea]KAA8901919.1 Rap1-interacting factor 1 N terminal-domain-containing protein [Sphaerosporella brunnea]KAA8906307.1 Rap1-interacting factor 1 N terminal-domain-containing protein [Sphaerosporella brunnea]KAA8910644.1 Rap1-interacting factor 1 N terminal-domain-containing protein [Sphaerosporella brunnea]
MLSDGDDPFTTGPADQRAFEKATIRPPTPPREAPRAKKVLGQGLAVHSGNLQLVSSPVSSRDPSPPTSSAESASEKPKKRVGWSGWTTYHKSDTPVTPSNQRVRPSASTDPKSLKSILKQTSASPYLGSPTLGVDQPFIANTHSSFTTMLESAMQALASTERSKKLDTYIAFCNILRAYDDIPDWNSMEKKMPALCGYLKRDLVAKMEEGGSPDSQLTQQATKLLTIICWYERLVGTIDDQTASFFIQHATQKIEDPQTSKASVILYLHFLAQQKFAAPKTMTTEKCNRIITALESLDERVTGKSITKERIEIYSKLLSQSRLTMVARASDWMRNAFGGLLNHIKEVRLRSLMFLREAAMVMGKEKAIARTISAIFNQDNEGKRIFESIRTRLDHFVKKEHEGQYVSQLWAVLLLLTQSVGDKWDFFTPWLRIIETCFNVSEPEVKVEAQLAWSRLIYISNIGPNTQRKLLELMCKPVEQYLDPRNASLNTRKPRKAALSNVCVYLYYGMRPNAHPKQLSEIWDVVVVGLIQNLVLAGSEANDGCNILCSLFDGSTSKRWSEDRLLTGHPFMRTDEIPRLDPKWVRSNCDKVLGTVEVALRRASWEQRDNAPGARVLWKRFTQTLADAGSKEIKITPELMEAVSHLFNMFQRIWSNRLESSQTMTFIEKFTFLVEEALESLGTLCFTEKQLAVDETSKFFPASTPTHKYSSDSNNKFRYPPLLHLFRLLLEPPPGVSVDEQYFNCARRILDKCCSSQDSRRKKLHILASCEALLPRRGVSAVHIGLWDILAELTRSSLPGPTREKSLVSPSPVGNEFKDAVSILKGATLQHVAGWESLCEDLITIIQNELSEAQVSNNVIAPLAESLRYSNLDSNLGLSLRRAVILVQKANHGKKNTIEGMFRGHLGLGSDRKPINSDSFEHLYALISTLLLKSYETPDQDSLALGADLCRASIDFISRAPSGSSIPLKQMQEGLGLWTKDPSHLLSQKNGFSASATTKLWERILQVVRSLPQHDSELLLNFNVLLSSGFESWRKGTVNATIKLWNDTFGKQRTLNYPSRLRTALAKLKTVADISLPDFPEENLQGIFTPPVFAESQEGEPSQSVDDIPWSSPTPARQLFPESKSRASTPAAMVKETPYGRARKTFTPRSHVLTSTPTRSKPLKPKHMDSQLNFVAVGGAPGLEAQDSQLMTEHQKEVREEQARAAEMFPELTAGASRKPKKKMKLATGSPSPQRQASIGASHSPEPEEAAGAAEPLVSFIAESQLDPDPQPCVTPRTSNQACKGAQQSAIAEHPGLTDVDSDNDVNMTACDNYSQKRHPRAEALSFNLSSDSPSGDDNFVDAQDAFPNKETTGPARSSSAPEQRLSDDYEVSPSKDIAEIAVAISPVKNGEEYAPVDDSESVPDGPDAQIIAEVRSAAGTPPIRTNRKRSKKRKRETPVPQGSVASPKMLDTIVIAAEPNCQSPFPRLNTAGESERPLKRARAKAIDVTPVRISARKNKGIKATPHGYFAAGGSDFDGMSGEASAASTPTRTRTRDPASSKRARTSREKTPRKRSENVKTSFVEETQTDSYSSISDSKSPSRIVATPRKGRQHKELYTDDVDADELQIQSPKHSISEIDSAESASLKYDVARRSKRRATSSLATTNTVLSPYERDQVGRSADDGAVKNEHGQPAQPAETISPANIAMDALRKALDMVHSADMTVSEIASIEDEVFEAFSKLRDKKKKARR